MDKNLIALIAVVVYLVGSLIYRLYLPLIKGTRGERRVAKKLRKLDEREYVVLNDIYLSTKSRTTQIDHLIVSEYGIFVIETKNYQGWIHGSETSEYWTQSIYKSKTQFRNPIKQNWAHIYALKELLTSFRHIKYHSIIVFAGNATLKNVYSKTPVIYRNELLDTIWYEHKHCISTEAVRDITDIILNHQDKKLRKKHKSSLKQELYTRQEKEVYSMNCPKCEGSLKVRSGRYGKFYGCSNYPYCRYTQPL